MKAMRVVALAAALTLAALPAMAAKYVIVVQNYAFHDVPATAHVGDTIEFVNKDQTEHTATADNGAFNKVLQPGQPFSYRLRRPGRLSFHCRYHSYMKGAIAVER